MDILTTVTEETATFINKQHRSILRRCQKPISKLYAEYGEKGITVSDDWLSKAKFYSDILKKLESQGIDPEYWGSKAGMYRLQRKDKKGPFSNDNTHFIRNSKGEWKVI